MRRIEYADFEGDLREAVEQGWALNSYSNPMNAGAENITLELALDLVCHDPGLIYLTKPE